MKFTVSRSSFRLAAATVCLAVMSVPSIAGDAPGTVAGNWQAHKANFDYYGITALYTCSGLEDHVKQILIHFGARKDAVVSAMGCPGGEFTPSHTASVRAEFYTLAPAEDATVAGAVSAQWTALEMTPRHPFFMGDGDCELVKDMQDLLSKNFSLRDVKYTTGCVPHDLTLNGFSVRAQALKPVPLPKVSALTH
jgi:hypothetical protein